MPRIAEGLVQPYYGFVQQIRDVLARLYDYPYLQAHPLAYELGPVEHLRPQEQMLFLRKRCSKLLRT